MLKYIKNIFETMTADGQGKNCPDEKAIAQHAENPGDFLHLASLEGIKIMPTRKLIDIILKALAFRNNRVHK